LDKGHAFTHTSQAKLARDLLSIYQENILEKMEHIVCSVPLPQVLSFLGNEVDRSQHTRIVTLWIHFQTFLCY